MVRLIKSYKKQIERLDKQLSNHNDSASWGVLQGTKETLEGVVIDLEKAGKDLIAMADQMENEQINITEMSYGNDIETNQNILYGIQRIVKLIKQQVNNEQE